MTTHRAAHVPAVRLLVRSYLRRDRWMLLWWCVGGTLLYYTQAVSVDGLYATQAEFDVAAASMEGNAAFIAMAGPPRALNTIGGQVTWQATAFGVIVAGLMSMFLVSRHTRAEEESGRDELVRAAAVPRRAPLVAAMVVAAIANLLLGALVSASLVAYSLAPADSLALGVGLALAGFLFAALTLLAAQLTSATRVVYGIVGATLGASYALRAIGDVTGGWLSWLSPIGWYQAMHAFSGLRWWPAIPLAASAGLVTVVALRLFERRDIGAGLWAARPGPATAGPRLAGPIGLTWRLQRGSVIGWSLGMFLTGLSYGSIGDSAGDLIGGSAATQEIFGGGADLVAGFFATSAMMLAMLASGFAISSVLRLRGEESEGRAEVLLATGLNRRHWVGAHAVVTVLGTFAALVAAALGLGLGYLGVTGAAGDAWRYAVPVLQYAAPVLVLAALTLLVLGVAPRAGVVAWLPLVLALVVLLFGDLWRLPGWVRGLSPFDHLALVPLEQMAWAPVGLVLLVAAVLGVAAQMAYARRDIG